MMKETYKLILLKLNKDLKGFREIEKDTLKYSHEDKLGRIYHERIIAKIMYCEDLIEFFENVYKNID